MSPRSARLEWRRSDTDRGRNGTVGCRLRHAEGGIRNDVEERTDLWGDREVIARAKEQWMR